MFSGRRRAQADRPPDRGVTRPSEPAVQTVLHERTDGGTTYRPSMCVVLIQGAAPPPGPNPY
ncbi:hypothetical protein GCM10020358_78390 [Amorphoplanes nipponensis]|uniref:Uncharacterized protein n=1 Tax=Actinoplanes nipponensis TaxID=135950 RepID=A0A919JLJ5_9ACTN|nr:hypothetical protein Ani05nite_63150 [Actinoplanes nipponensis]